MTVHATKDPTATAEREIVIGVVMMAGTAMVLQPGMDTVTKYLGGQIPPLQVAWARMFFQMLFTLPIVMAWYGLPGLAPRPYGLQILRGLFLSATVVTFTFAVTLMPLADAIALVFVAPLIVTALSAIVLREAVGPRRWTAVVVGLVGAMIIIRPGSGLFGAAALLPIVAAVCYACYLIVTRRLTTHSPPISTHFFTAVVGTAALSVPLAIGLLIGGPVITPSAPTAVQWGLLVIIGIIASISHLVIIFAYSRSPASMLAPLTYLEIVGASAFGYLVFGDFPDGWTWVGVVVIVASGLYVVLRARRIKTALPPDIQGPRTGTI
ncbi:DMT family transporter [Microbaculum marinum]|uniref:DMT family transporter n=1 Tax=Microbaculum marinum TaxID=1764581 RepID=A0AAW9RPQ3_9HYPH